MFWTETKSIRQLNFSDTTHFGELIFCNVYATDHSAAREKSQLSAIRAS